MGAGPTCFLPHKFLTDLPGWGEGMGAGTGAREGTGCEQRGPSTLTVSSMLPRAQCSATAQRRAGRGEQSARVTKSHGRSPCLQPMFMLTR